MPLIRSFIFAIFLIFWTLSLGIIALPVILLPYKYRHFVGKLWACVILFMLRIICKIDYQIIGYDNVKILDQNEQNFIIASKHQSAWDTVIFLALFGNPSYILKKELLFIPIYGIWLKILRMVPIDRDLGAKSLKKMLKLIKDELTKYNRKIIIFPQGTRTKIGEKKKYQVGIYAIYNAVKLPVIPVALNSGLYWNKSFIKNKGTIKIKFLPHIEYEPSKKREEFMKELEDVIEKNTNDLQIIGK